MEGLRLLKEAVKYNMEQGNYSMFTSFNQFLQQRQIVVKEKMKTYHEVLDNITNT